MSYIPRKCFMLTNNIVFGKSVRIKTCPYMKLVSI